jgi:hypothetical protein
MLKANTSARIENQDASSTEVHFDASRVDLLAVTGFPYEWRQI